MINENNDTPTTGGDSFLIRRSLRQNKGVPPSRFTPSGERTPGLVSELSEVAHDTANMSQTESQIKILQLQKEIELLRATKDTTKIIDENVDDIDSDDSYSAGARYCDMTNKKQINSDLDKSELSKLTQNLAEALVKIVSKQKDDNMSEFLARQSVGRDLPFFDGKPEDWPLFFHQYCNSTELCKFSKDENMARLQKCLKGEAREAVQALLIYPDNIDTVMTTLKRRFGRPDFIIKSLISKTSTLPAAREDKPETIIRLATAVQNLTVTLENLKRPDYLYNPQLIEDIENKLSPLLQMFWTQQLKDKKRYNLRDLCNWLDQQSQAASIRVIPKANQPDIRQESKRNRNKVMTTTQVNETPQIATTRSQSFISNNVKGSSISTANQKCLHCEDTCETLSKCKSFIEIDNDEKWKFVTSQKLCFSCLRRGHDVQHCRVRRSCGEDNCTKPHHRLLHKKQTSNNSVTTCMQTSARNRDTTTLLKIIPVIVSNGNKELKCFALLDSGSTISLISSNVASELGTTGELKPLCIQWGNGVTHSEETSRNVTIKIRGTFDNAKIFTIRGVKTVDKLHLPRQSVNRQDLIDRWKYLHHIPFEGYNDATPLILIGEDNAILTSSRNIIHRDNDAPVATRTWLGWTISGNRAGTSPCKSSLVFAMCEPDVELHNLVKTSFQTDNFGVAIKNDTSQSKEDRRALQIMDETTTRSGDRWETGLLWRANNIHLPDSRITALHRLLCLEKKLDKNPSLKSSYVTKIEDYLNKGYLRKLEHGVQSTKTWYLPHFPVVNPKKPNKLRIVFDGAAKTNGYSLNDFLIQGPDHLKPLQSVLFNFRKRRIAFTADIREMYHQIKIIDDDKNSQLILWRGDDSDTVNPTLIK